MFYAWHPAPSMSWSQCNFLHIFLDWLLKASFYTLMFPLFIACLTKHLVEASISFSTPADKITNPAWLVWLCSHDHRTQMSIYLRPAEQPWFFPSRLLSHSPRQVFGTFTSLLQLPSPPPRLHPADDLTSPHLGFAENTQVIRWGLSRLSTTKSKFLLHAVTAVPPTALCYQGRKCSPPIQGLSSASAPDGVVLTFLGMSLIYPVHTCVICSFTSSFLSAWLHVSTSHLCQNFWFHITQYFFSTLILR